MSFSTVAANVILFASCALAADDTEVERKRLVRFILSGMNSNRQLLRSGIYQARGRIKSERGGKAPEGGDVEISAAFDIAGDLLRFERAQTIVRSVPIFSGAATNVEAPPGTILDIKKATMELVPGIEKGLYIRAKDRCLIWITPWRYKNTGMNTSVAIYDRNAPPPENIAPFDVRAIGLYFPVSLNRNVPYESVYDGLEKSNWDGASREGDGVFRIGTAAADSGAFRVYWIDERQGFSPIRMEAYRRIPGGKAPKEPQVVSETSWSKLGDVWVPATTRIVDRQGLPGSLDTYELAFTWQSVNEAIPADLLTIEGIDAPDKTPIYDFRLATPLQIGLVSKKRDSGVPRSILGTKSMVIVANITLLLCLLVFFLARYVRRARRLGKN